MTTLITPANFPEAKRDLITAFYAASDRRDVDKVSELVTYWSGRPFMIYAAIHYTVLVFLHREC